MKTLITSFAFNFIFLFSNAQDCTETIVTQSPVLKTSLSQSGLKDNFEVDIPMIQTNQLKERSVIFGMNSSKEHFSYTKRSINHKIVYDDQCEGFRQLRNTGGWTILGGGVVTTIGVAMILADKNANWLIEEGDAQFKTGLIVWVAGDAIQAIGSILNIIGKIGYHHCNKSALHFKSDGNNIGLAYNFMK